jgi:hypothetical protein
VSPSPLDPFYLVIVATGLLVAGSPVASILWLVLVALAWPARHRVAKQDAQ